MTVVVARGEPSHKLVAGIPGSILIRPFVGADRPDNPTSFGVGYFGENGGGAMWGLLSPRVLIQSWRAMKLLEVVPRIEFATLCNCWYAANSQVHHGDQERINDLERCFAVREEFITARARILTTLPTPEALEAMLKIVKDNRIELSHWEVKDIGALYTRPLPSLAELLTELRADSERRQQDAAAKFAAAEAERAEERRLAAKTPLPTRRGWRRFFGLRA